MSLTLASHLNASGQPMYDSIFTFLLGIMLISQLFILYDLSAQCYSLRPKERSSTLFRAKIRFGDTPSIIPYQLFFKPLRCKTKSF